MTEVRETSREAWHNLLASGKLPGMQQVVLDLLFEHGSLTGREAAEAHTGSDGVLLNKRFSELRDAGYVVELPPRKCRVTGQIVIPWDLADNVPEEGRMLYFKAQVFVAWKSGNWKYYTAVVSTKRTASLLSKTRQLMLPKYRGEIEFMRICARKSISFEDYDKLTADGRHWYKYDGGDS